MTTQINVTRGPKSLVDQSRQNTSANRNNKLENENSKKVTKQSADALANALADQGLVDKNTPIPFDFKRPTFIRQKPAAQRFDDNAKWLLVPSGPYNPDIGGFATIVKGLDPSPFGDSSTLVFDNDALTSSLVNTGPFGNGLQSTGSGAYNSENKKFTINNNTFTFECFISNSGESPIIEPARWFYSARGSWQWNYTVLVHYPDYMGGDQIINGTIYTTPPNFDNKPLAPSELFTSGEFIYSYALLSETKVYTDTPANYVRSVNAPFESFLTLNFGLSGDQYSSGGSINLHRQIVTPAASPGYVRETSDKIYIASNSWSGTEVDSSALNTPKHFAFVHTAESFRFYYDGNLVNEVAVTEPLDKTNSYFGVSLNTSSTTPDPQNNPLYTAEQLIPSSLASSSDVIDSYGHIAVASAMRFRVSGLRFTANRALYSGSTYTPPTSITTLAP